MQGRSSTRQMTSYEMALNALEAQVKRAWKPSCEEYRYTDEEKDQPI